jgi:hypothetical protein
MSDDHVPFTRIVVDANGNVIPPTRCCRCRPCWSCRLLHPGNDRHGCGGPQEVVTDADVR